MELSKFGIFQMASVSKISWVAKDLQTLTKKSPHLLQLIHNHKLRMKSTQLSPWKKAKSLHISWVLGGTRSFTFGLTLEEMRSPSMLQETCLRNPARSPTRLTSWAASMTIKTSLFLQAATMALCWPGTSKPVSRSTNYTKKTQLACLKTISSTSNT